MTSDYIDEELKIMEEGASSNGTGVASGIDIEDPIRTLNLEQVISIKAGASLQEVVATLQEKRIGCITIENDSNDTVGIFTERDILKKVIGKNLDLNKEIVDDYMTPNPELLSENDPIAFALNRMSDGSYRHIPITRDGQVRFMLSVKDIVDEIAKTYRKMILNLPPDLKQQTTQYGG